MLDVDNVCVSVSMCVYVKLDKIASLKPHNSYHINFIPWYCLPEVLTNA